MELVKSGMLIGLGMGSTSLVIEELGRLISEGKVWFLLPKYQPKRGGDLG